MAALQCSWEDVMDEESRNLLKTTTISTGFSILCLSSWLNYSIMWTNLREDESYWFLMTFTMTSWNRIAWTIMPWKNRIEMTDGVCILFGFLDTIATVAEVEWLTHICIERYVLTKYIVKGLPMPKDHYRLFKKLTLFFTLFYSLFPFIVGRYTYDFTCTSCTFDMILPESWERYLIVTVLLLRSVKPAAFMLLMLKWTYDLECKLPFTKESTPRKFLTLSVAFMVIANLFSWAPLALIRGHVILSQLLYNTLPMPSEYEIKCAMLFNWLAPCFTVVCLMAVNPYIAGKMFFMDDKAILWDIIEEGKKREAKEKEGEEKREVKEKEGEEKIEEKEKEE